MRFYHYLRGGHLKGSAVGNGYLKKNWIQKTRGTDCGRVIKGCVWGPGLYHDGDCGSCYRPGRMEKACRSDPQSVPRVCGICSPIQNSRRTAKTPAQHSSTAPRSARQGPNCLDDESLCYVRSLSRAEATPVHTFSTRDTLMVSPRRRG